MNNTPPNISQRNFILFIKGLLEDAITAYGEDRAVDGNAFMEDAFDYMTIFLSKARGE